MSEAGAPDAATSRSGADAAPPVRLRFAVAPGVELAADGFGDPSAQPVVLLHGGGQTRHAWSGTGRALAAAGWYAVAVDLRGHGDSSWAPGGEYTPTSFAGDVIELARQLGAPPVLVGASLGGLASLQAIDLAPPDFARGLVLVDIATRFEPKGVERIHAFMTSRPDGFASLEEAADAVAAYHQHRERPSDVSGLAKNLRQGEDGRWRWHWDPRFLEADQIGRVTDSQDESPLDGMARRLRLPTLLVRGRVSDLLSQDGADHFLSLAPHAAFVDIHEAGHMVAGDRNDAFTSAVIDFLRDAQLGPRRSA